MIKSENAPKENAEFIEVKLIKSVKSATKMKPHEIMFLLIHPLAQQQF